MISISPRRFLSAFFPPKLPPTLYNSFVSLSAPSTIIPLSNKQSIIQPHSIPISITPHLTDISRLLNLCQEQKHLKPLKSLLHLHGLIDHEPLIEAFIKRCFDLGAPELALSAFASLRNPTVLLQNRTIRSLCDDGLFEQVLSIYYKCRSSGCPSDNYTFPFVIKACAALGALHIGEGVHSLVLRTGYGDNSVVQTSLVDLYARCSDMETARLVLDTISQPDLVSWNALITGYSLNIRNDKALEVFREIHAMELKPNVTILSTMIPVCTRSRSLYAGKSLHGFAVKSGYFEDESLIPALISLYSSDGDLHVARKLFTHSLVKNVAIWNAMISAYTQNRKPDDALEMFKNMLLADMKPNTITYLSILSSCVDFGCIFYGESLHACVIKAGLVNQLSMLTSLLSMYAKLGELNSSEFLFSQMPERNLLSWNSLISAYVHNRQWDLSLAKLREMQFAGFVPDAVSIISVLSACSELKAIMSGKSAHGYSIRKGFFSNLNLFNALLSLYSNCGKILSSFKLFSKATLRNTISWNTLISGCVHNGDATDAVVLLNQMQEEGMDLDLVTMISVLPCYDRREELVQGMTIHSCAIKMGFESDISLGNALISMYFNCGEVDAGMLIFESMFNKSIVSWNALLTGYRYNNWNEHAMLYFYRMIKENQKPNYVTLLNVLPVCYTLVQGKSIHAYASRRGIELEASFLTSLVLMYSRFGNTKYCLFLFEMGEKRNISLWNAIIAAHVQMKNAEKAVDFFLQLLQMEMGPDYMTILSLVSACVQINNLNLTNSIMGYLKKEGFDKDVAVSNALIDLYAKSGNIPIARKLFDDSLEKDNISWGVMINGYGLHGDGEAVLSLVSKMENLNFKPDEVTYLSILSACSHAGLVDQGRLTFNSMVNNGLSPRMEHYACLIDLLGRTGHLNEAYGIVKKLPHRPLISLLESLLGACIVHGDFELGEEIGRLLLEMDPENSGLYVMLHNVYAAAGRWEDANKVRSVMEERRLRKVPGFSLVEG